MYSIVPPWLVDSCIGNLSEWSLAETRKDRPICFRLQSQQILSRTDLNLATLAATTKASKTTTVPTATHLNTVSGLRRSRCSSLDLSPAPLIRSFISHPVSKRFPGAWPRQSLRRHSRPRLFLSSRRPRYHADAIQASAKQRPIQRNHAG